MQSNNLLELAGAISSGAVRVVDLTFTLSPDFPVIVLPPEFGQAAPVRIQEISRYDGRGPAWYWNNVTFGEHTGTHFDAPIHWFTGKSLPNNAVDTMPAKDMIAPACVIDCSAQAAQDPDFLLTVPLVEAWEAKHGRIPERNWALLRTDWSKKGWRDYSNLRDDGAHTPGPNPDVMKWLVEERAASSDLAPRPSARMQGRPAISSRLIRRITSCTARVATACNACATWISFRPPGLSSSPRR
ncbi:kynurenine formamidase [Bradyrhizobium diazoefficiens]